MGQVLRGAVTCGVTLLVAAGASVLSAQSGWAAVAAEPGDTTVTLDVGIVSGPAFQRVPLAATVSAVDAPSVPTGSCTFSNAGVVLAEVAVEADGRCQYASTGFGPGDHSLAVEYVPDGAFAAATSPPVTASFQPYSCRSGDRCDDPSTVLPPIPRGELVIATPYTPAAPFDLGSLLLDPGAASYSVSAPFGSVDDPAAGVTIVDTRTGGTPFTAHVAATDFVGGAAAIPGSLLGFTGVTPVYIPGNAMTAEASAVSVRDVPSLGPAGAMFATGTGPGSVFVVGLMSLTRVPTSTPPGVYVSTVTFTLS